MKNTHNYIMLLVATLVFVSCSEDEIVPNNNQVQPGGNVQLGLSLENLSRTIYDVEKNNAFPIYWSEGDKVIVASPHCASGRNNAEYEVTPVAGQAYAEAITKVGESAVQWGSSQTADFYSVFPSKNATFSVLSENNVTASLKINSEQNAALVLKGNVYSAADMDNVVMYAMTQDVENGQKVDLQYIPYSTVLEFEVNVTADAGKSIFIQSMTLTAPIAIAGNFNLAFPATNTETPSVSAVGNNNSNSIKMNFASAPQLDATNTTLKAKFCLMPISGVENLNDWTIALEVREGDNEIKNYTKTLSVGNTVNTALTPGKVHKIKLPALTAEKEWEYKPEVWMTQIPKYETIYLTEYSIPGAWYAHDAKREGYQASGETISNLWSNGIRAFALECRSSSTLTWTGYEPSSVVISGTQNNGLLGDYTLGGTKIREVIKSIADEVAETDEFAVLVLSYADGGSDGQRAKDHNFFINGVKAEIDASGATNIYNKEITSETITSDVIGQLIIKINVDEELSKSSYDNSSNALFSYVPHMNQLSSDKYSTPLFSKLYWKTWEDSYETYKTESTEEFLWCFSSANRTHADGTGTYDIPTYSQRKEALNAMMLHSDKIYENSTHNVWFYFNAGGTEAESQDGETTIANYAGNMNPWLLEVINRKMNGGTDEDGYLVYSKPSPLGIVMFNQCTSETGKSIIKAIIEMNNKFNLKHASVNSNTQSQTRDSYDSSLSNGGNVISLD